MEANWENAELPSILSILENKEADDMRKIAALTDFCEILAMASKEISVDSFIPILVGFLMQGSPDVKLLATRGVTYICDIFPWKCASVVRKGAVSAMCEHLLTIDYMDLAEESVQALEKISRRCASSCLRDGVFMAVLMHIDFFSSAIKRLALSTAATISVELSPSTIDLAMEEIPKLLALLSDSDAKMVEHACVCLSQIAGAAAASPENLQKFSRYGLVATAISLISVTNSATGQASLSSSRLMAVIGLLSTCASASAVLAGEMIERGISSILRDILTASSIVSDMIIPLFSNDLTTQLYKIVSFANELLPLLSNEKISLPSTDDTGWNHSTTNFSLRNISDSSTREKLFQEKPELLVQFGMNLFPLMIQIYGSSIKAKVSHQCLEVISKLLFLSTPEMLKLLLQETNISRFLAEILSVKDIKISLAALQMAEILIQKLPDVIFNMFMREGVFHAVGTLISTGSTVSGEYETHTAWKTQAESEAESEEEGDEGSEEEKEGDEGSEEEREASRIEELVSAHARHFKATYFLSNSGSTKARAAKSFCKFTNLCKKLDGTLCDLKGEKMKGKQSRVVYDNHYGFKEKFEGNTKQGKGKSRRKGKKSCDVSDNNKIPSILADILAELCQDEGVSTFEFVKSGIVASLLNYFAGRDLKKDKMSKADSIGHQLETLKRFETFVDITLPLIVRGKEPPLTVLVQKLQDALSSEDFPIQLSQGPRSHINDPSNLYESTAFRWPLKVRLCRAQGEKALSSHPSTILYIEPLARITDIEDYLFPKLQINKIETNCSSCVAKPGTHVTSTKVAAEGGSSPRSRSPTATENPANSTSSKGGGKSVLRIVTTDFNGTQARSGASMGDASKREPEQKHQQEGFSDEGLLDEPTSICVMDGPNSILLRDPEDASGMASTSDIDDITTIRAASISTKGSSRNREHPTLNFFIGGKLLDRSSTIYEAIQKNVEVDGDESTHSGSECMSESIWYKVHKIRYKRANTPRERNLTETHKHCAGLMTFKNLPCIDKTLQRKLPCDIKMRDSTHDILLLLQVLHELNKLAPCLRANSLSDAFAQGRLKNLDELKANGPMIPQQEFLSGKLTTKLSYQLEDATMLATFGLPNWCHQLTANCPFLFPFEIRRKYFKFTALHRIPPNPFLRNNDAVRLPRLKVRVSRKHVLEAAAQMIDFCCGQKAALEIEYYNEVGSGLGPTLEFYTLISHELQRSKLGMWRTSAGELLQATLGLFPRPYPPHTDSSCGRENFKVIENFTLLGFLMAKALQDGRLLDLPLSTAFYKLLLGKDLNLYDIKYFDIELGTTLQEMQALATRRQYLESMADDKSKEISSLHYRGVKIEDLCIDFTLPGFPDYLLKSGGSNILVTIDNLDEYVSLAVDATITTGIIPQIEAFRKGFNQVFPISTLQIFSEEELDTLLCGVRDLWEAEMLRDHIKFDHGYTAQCPFALDFLEIVAAFTPTLQRALLQFVTGCPNLPLGGLSALNPKLTVVRKNPTHSNLTEAVDRDLPSAMTCANYLKLPPYSTKETMRDRLLYAITEGQGSFDLS